VSDVLITLSENAVRLTPVAEADLARMLQKAGGFAAALAARRGFAARAGEVLEYPGPDGELSRILLGLGSELTPHSFRVAAETLPPGDYAIESLPAGLDPTEIAIAWASGTYRFERYKKGCDGRARLVLPSGADAQAAGVVIDAHALARDMINTPANDMGPAHIEAIARDLAQRFGANLAVTTGDDLLTKNYPAVHAVGRAAAPARAPRMIELSWGEPGDPIVALLGKGVVFDSGGLDIKSATGMRNMKKDMGGAAHALALARMVMAFELRVRLVVLIPAVENAVSGDAMRPGDVLASRKGLSIEVSDTDSEGRLILADALARAAEYEPALTLDLATLTAAARQALGPQVVAFYTDDESLAVEIAAASRAAEDPLWRMPMWKGYDISLNSEVADLQNDSDSWAQAGSVTAALFLRRFAPRGPWAHFDIFGWNPQERPGHPVGAAVQALGALLNVLKQRYPRNVNRPD
jgi:leucyl aminopeptidase